VVDDGIVPLIIRADLITQTMHTTTSSVMGKEKENLQAHSFSWYIPKKQDL